ncbi:MAG: hypothetical protein U0W24_03280 [Bacteroidales bacterium]
MKILIFFISILFVMPQQTETYFIVKIKGDIINANTGKKLEQGDELKPTDKLIFSNKNDMALLVSDLKNKYTLSYLESDVSNDQLISTVNKSVKLTKRNKIASRGLITNAAIKDLKEFLGDNEFTVIGNTLSVKLNKQAFENQSVEAKYENNGKPFQKQIMVGDTILNLSRKDLGAKSNGEVKIYHVEFYKLNKSEESVEKITRLDLNFIDEQAIRDELITIIGVYKKKNYTKNDMKAFLMEYFNDFYGNTHMYQLSQYVDKIVEDNMK